MPILGSCCFCWDLKVGTRLIGILNLIGALLGSLGLLVMLVIILFLDAGAKTAKALNEAHRPDPSDEDYTEVHQQTATLFEILQMHLNYVKISLFVTLALAILSIITTSMLIHGVRRDRRALLLPFIVQYGINILVFSALNIGVIVLFGAHEVIVGMVLSALGVCLVQLYFLLVVISQYQALGLIRMHEEISMK